MLGLRAFKEPDLLPGEYRHRASLSGSPNKDVGFRPLYWKEIEMAVSSVTNTAASAALASSQALFMAQGTQPSQSGGRGDATLEEIRRVIGDESGKYSMTEKAKVFRHAMELASDPTVSTSIKQESARIWENSSFFKEVTKVQQRYSDAGKGLHLVDTQTAADVVIGFYDSLEPWQKELPDFYDLRDYWSVAKEIDMRLAARVRAGAFKIGDQDPTDPEAKMLLSLFKEVNRGEKFSSYDARRDYLRDVLATLRSDAPSGMDRVDLIDLSDQAKAHLGIK